MFHASIKKTLQGNVRHSVKIIEDTEYKLEQVFNMEETDLF